MDFERATAAPDTVAAPISGSFRRCIVLSLGARKSVRRAPDRDRRAGRADRPSLKPGDLNLVARTKDAYVYENPRALPRVMLATEWRKADFDAMIRDGGWPDVDPRRTVLLENAPAGAPRCAAAPAPRASCAITTPKS